MNDRFKFRVPVFYDGKFKAFKKYSLCNGVVIWKEPETIGELWIEDELKRNNPHLSLGHDEQCTGLKDKNGKLIYKGDIVITYYAGEPTGQTYIYRWEAPAFYVEPFEKGKPSGRHYYYFAVENERCEIIGNVHENPELLEQSNLIKVEK